MKKYVNLFVFVFMVGACFSQGKAQTKSAVSYKNPVVDIAMPDPTVIKAADGYFYMYATESTRNVPIMKSKDLVQWTYCNTAFTNKTRPRFEPKAGIWAPDINYINNKYVLYYAMSVWGGEQTCGIGVATTDSPQGPLQIMVRCSVVMRSVYRTRLIPASCNMKGETIWFGAASGEYMLLS